jgi:hypothetical protein
MDGFDPIDRLFDIWRCDAAIKLHADGMPCEEAIPKQMLAHDWHASDSLT